MRSGALAIFASLLVACGAPPVAPPTDLRVRADATGVVVSWRRSADDGGGRGVVRGYQALRASSKRGPFLPFAQEKVEKTGRGRLAIRDTSGPPGETHYQVWAIPEREAGSPSHAGGTASSATIAAAAEAGTPAARVPPPRPPRRVEGSAPSSDDGTHVEISFRASPDDREGGPVVSYVVLRGRSRHGPFEPFSDNEAPTGASELRDVVLASIRDRDVRARAQSLLTSPDRLAPLLRGTPYEGRAPAVATLLAGGEAAAVREAPRTFRDRLEGTTSVDPSAPFSRAVTDTVAGPGPFFYRVYAVPAAGEAVAAATVGPVSPDAALFGAGKAGMAVLLAATFGLTLVFVRAARTKGEKMYIRRIAGVDAIEEAIGRATEMGRPVLYVPGIDEIQQIQTIASLLILGRVAEMVARYDAQIKVPCCIPLVAAVAEEVVRQAFYNAGRPDAHRPQNIQWISSEQFAFCAGTNGIMLREKPATNIYLGRFFAESLILAETGYVNRAIQIGGTAEVTQLPFFIAACDYTLIGEELFAVSAYMTREPRLLGTLKAADWVKAGVLGVLAIMSLAAIVFWVGDPDPAGGLASACLAVLDFLAPPA